MRRPGEEPSNVTFASSIMLFNDIHDRTGRQYLMLAVRIGDSGHVCMCKQEVECDRQEGKVSHQGEVLAVQNFLVEPV